MFDIGFSELLLIGVVALVVIGPERLPQVARTAGTWLGRLNRYVADVKQDIDRDMKLEELRKLQEQMRETAQKYEIMADEAEQKAKGEVGNLDKMMQAMAATEGGDLLKQLSREPDEVVLSSAAEGNVGESPKVAADSSPGATSLPDAPAAFTSDLHAEVEVDVMAAVNDQGVPAAKNDKNELST